MCGFVFEWLTDPLGLPVHDLWEYGILAVIGILAFGFGWTVSGGGVFGSIVHWVVRFLAFLVLWAVAYVLLAAIQWLIANVVLVCGTVILAVAAVVMGSVFGLHPYKRQYREVA